jgi:UPF0271 protein
MSLLLNCDLGESFGSYTMGMDEAVMPYIDQANIACGFHAGDAMVMQKTIGLARQHNVTIGAHPSYKDLTGFGRRSMNCSRDEIISDVLYQLSALDGMAASQGVCVEYVKPHGALYNDMMAKANVRLAIMEAVAGFHRPISLMLQATPVAQQHKEEAAQFSLQLQFEAFADRCYNDDGSLLSRTKEGAVHSAEKMLAQVKQLSERGQLTTINGKVLTLQADTLCVHGDNIEGVKAIAAIRDLISK